ncbi:MAG: ABC transporter permease [Planctomycetia bacterium]
MPRSFAEMRGTVDRIVGGVVGALWAILGLGFVIGSLGVANTVAMNVAEQQRTLGLLRSLGMTRRQVTRLVVVESLILGVAGCAAGVVGGLVTAAFIQIASQPLLGHPLSPSLRPTVIAANLAGAVAVTALAAYIPARRAARIDLLESLAAD